jgi:hypothetical protein
MTTGKEPAWLMERPCRQHDLVAYLNRFSGL